MTMGRDNPTMSGHGETFENGVPTRSPEDGTKVAFLTHNGARLAYRHTGGQCPGVVFLSGFTSDMTGSKATALEAWAVARGHAFTRFDYQGHGQSDGAFVDGGIGLWTADALVVFDRVTQGPQGLVGSRVASAPSSAACCWSRWPDRTARLAWSALPRPPISPKT